MTDDYLYAFNALLVETSLTTGCVKNSRPTLTYNFDKAGSIFVIFSLLNSERICGGRCN